MWIISCETLKLSTNEIIDRTISSFKVSEFQSFRFSEFQSFKVSEFPSFKVSEFQSFSFRFSDSAFRVSVRVRVSEAQSFIVFSEFDFRQYIFIRQAKLLFARSLPVMVAERGVSTKLNQILKMRHFNF
jgi:hypothetical protein